MGAPSFSALQGMCRTSPIDYGTDAQSVYSAFFDAYVAQRRGGLSKERFCAFQAAIEERYRAYRQIPARRRKVRGRASFWISELRP